MSLSLLIMSLLDTDVRVMTDSQSSVKKYEKGVKQLAIGQSFFDCNQEAINHRTKALR